MKKKYLKVINDWYGLLKVAKVRHRSPSAYFDFEKYQGDLLIEYLYQKGISIKNKKLLDVGSGIGGYDAAFHKEGARVFSLDLDVPVVVLSNCHVMGNALTMPYTNDIFDIVICSSLIEHVQNPVLLLMEILRVIRKEGFLYLSFPPYYSPVGGHHFSPFHLLGEKAALNIFR